MQIMSRVQRNSENEIYSENESDSLCEVPSGNDDCEREIRERENTYVPLKGYDDYEIAVEYPHTIRRISNGYVPKESYNKKTVTFKFI